MPYFQSPESSSLKGTFNDATAILYALFIYVGSGCVLNPRTGSGRVISTLTQTIQFSIPSRVITTCACVVTAFAVSCVVFHLLPLPAFVEGGAGDILVTGAQEQLGRECVYVGAATVRRALAAALTPHGEEAAAPAPETHVRGYDTATVASHMKDFEAFVAKTAPKLHWKVWQDLGADPSRSNGGYDGWQHGFGQALFGPLPLPELMAEMKASVAAKVAALSSEGPANG